MDRHRNVSLIIFALFYTARADPNTNLISVLCNNDAYDPGDGYRASVQDCLADLIGNTAGQGYSYYASRPAPNNTFVYGHAACYGGLSSTDCTGCLGLAFPKLLNGCLYRIGSQIQVQDCRLRFENYPFTE